MEINIEKSNTESPSSQTTNIRKPVNFWFQRAIPFIIFLMLVILDIVIILSVQNIPCRETLFKEKLFDEVTMTVVFIGVFNLYGFYLIWLMIFCYDTLIEENRKQPICFILFTLVFFVYSCFIAGFYLKYSSGMLYDNSFTLCVMFQVVGIYSWIYMILYAIFLFCILCNILPDINTFLCGYRS